MQDVMETFAKCIELNIGINALTAHNIETLNRIIIDNAGEKSLEVLIFDPENPKINVRMPRRAKRGIKITRESLDAFKALPFLRMALKTGA
ncbi:MAG: hypothetical protein ACJAZH_001618 [Roseivirga sp.]|jgi:hypothetical protein